MGSLFRDAEAAANFERAAAITRTVPVYQLEIVLLFATLHLARAVGLFHGWLAKHLLVRTPVV